MQNDECMRDNRTSSVDESHLAAWTRINDLHYPQLTVTSIVTLSVSPCEVMSSFVLSLQGNLGQPLLLFPLSLAFV